MKVLVIGSGAREHAIVRALRADPAVEHMVAGPGNPGMAELARCEPLADSCDAHQVLALARRHLADLVVIGPEAPLVAGVADVLRAEGVAVFGPDQAAARLEGSKAFAKQVMAAAGVPTALAHVCTSADEVSSALDMFGPPYVVKDDGLAAGKGVVVTRDRATALTHARTCLGKQHGAPVLIEEFLDGPEVSVFCVTDGATVLALPPAQDFKKARDGDNGPNTGGMGAYSPLPWAPPDLTSEVLGRIAQPMIDEMRRRGTPFVGALYVGLALTTRGLRVVEFNSRFGDPDGQVVITRLRSPLGTLLFAAATRTLDLFGPLHWTDEYAVAVVLASAGYPDSPRTGDVITGLEEAAKLPNVHVLHAGTRRDASGALLSAGGRVLDVVATGRDLAEARETAYRAVGLIHLEGAHYRRDIALAAERGQARTAGSAHG